MLPSSFLLLVEDDVHLYYLLHTNRSPAIDFLNHYEQ